ncbi:MAG TPA: lysozyme inhibitor LprI family protein [Burkholderiales bacterium]|nr:lysozyme inhibitor LprI family protein [Burkholderiales bacterium]
MNRLAVLAVMVALAAPVPVRAALDCSRAKSNTEKLLCSNSRLAEADDRMALAFRGAIHRGADPRTLMEEQRAWNQDARDACNDVACMLDAYEKRISDLDSR